MFFQSFLRCSNCEHNFDDSHEPFLLPCFHVICSICRSATELKCHVVGCKRLYVSNELKHIDKCIYFVGILNSRLELNKNDLFDGWNEIGQNEDEEVCVECQAKTQGKCLNCNGFYCKSCFQVCHVGKLLRQHVYKVRETNDDYSSSFDHTFQSSTVLEKIIKAKEQLNDIIQACKNNRFQIQQNTIDAIQAVLKRFADVHNILQIIEGKTLQTLKSVSQNMLRNEQSIVDNANKLNQKLSMDDVSIHFLIQETEMEIEKLQKNVCDVHGPFNISTLNEKEMAMKLTEIISCGIPDHNSTENKDSSGNSSFRSARTSESFNHASGIFKNAIVIRIVDPNLFYLLTDDDFNESTQHKWNQIAEKSSVVSHIEIDGIYFAQKDSEWCFAKILSIDVMSNSCLMHFIVDGTQKQIKIEKLKEIPAEIDQMPGVIACSLHGIESLTPRWLKASIDFMKKLVSGKRLTAITMSSSNKNISVDLIVMLDAGQINVRYALFANGFASATVPTNDTFHHDIGLVSIENNYEIGANVNLIVTRVNSLNEFYAVEKQRTDEIDELSNNLNSFYAKSLEYEFCPTVGSIVVAHVNDQWKRARLLEPPRYGEYSLFLIDSGERTKTSWRHVRKIQPQFASVKAGVTRFSLNEVDSFALDDSRTSKNKFKQIAVGKQCEAKIERNLKNSFEVTLFVRESNCARQNVNEIFQTKFKSLSCESSLATSSKFSSRKLSKKERIDVAITKYVSPSEFYVHLTKNDERMQQMNENISKKIHEKLSDENKKCWSIGSKCFAKVSLSSDKQAQWCRGRVLHIINDEVEIYLRDFAKNAIVPMTSLQIDDCENDEPDFAVKCHLAYVRSAGSFDWSLTANDEIQNLIKTCNELAITIPCIKSNCLSTAVVLWGCKNDIQEDAKQWLNFNKILIEQGLASSIVKFDELDNHLTTDDKFDSSKSSYDENMNKLDYSYFVPTWLPAAAIESNTLECIPKSMDENLNIFVIEPKYEETFSNLRIMESNATVECLKNDWIIGEACMVEYDDGYLYRGEIVSIHEKTCTVMYIDYGHSIELSFGERKISKKLHFKDIPKILHKFRVLNIQLLSKHKAYINKVMTFCENIIFDKLCVIRIHESDANDIPPCTLKTHNGADLRSLLISEGFVEPSESREIAAPKTIANDSYEAQMENIDWNELERSLEHEKFGHYFEELSKLDMEHLSTIDEDLDDLSLSLSIDDDSEIREIVEKINTHFPFYQCDSMQSNLVCQFISVLSPTEVLLAPIDDQNETQYMEMLNLIQDSVCKMKRKHYFERGDPCIAFAKKTKLWQRAMILETENDDMNEEISVVYVDTLEFDHARKSNVFILRKKDVLSFPLKYLKVNLHEILYDENKKPEQLQRKLEMCFEHNEIVTVEFINKEKLEANIFKNNDRKSLVYEKLRKSKKTFDEDDDFEFYM